jgi:lipoate-protein ligase A
MDYLDLTWPTPAENLAADEALLDAAESDQRGESLRFWEAPSHFVVLGHSNSLAKEVDAAACAARNIPILRRCSGGGTVLQGPGILSYALVLNLNRHPDLATVSRANLFIMSKNAKILSSILNQETRLDGVTDLVVAGRKVSGNAQRRKRRFLLFHGTLLLAPDLNLMSQLLPMPSRQPDYRANRTHADFLGTIPAKPETLKAAWRHAWGAHPSPHHLKTLQLQQLVATKYNLPSWNRKF